MQKDDHQRSGIPTPPTSQKHHWNPGIPTHGVNPTSGCCSFLEDSHLYLAICLYISKLWTSTIYDDILDFEPRSDISDPKHPFKPQIPHLQYHFGIAIRRTPGHLSWLLDQCNQLRCPPIKPAPNWRHHPSRKMACHSSKCYSSRSNPSKLDGQILPFCRQPDVTPCDVRSLAEFRSTHSFFRCQKWGWASKGRMYLSSATAP